MTRHDDTEFCQSPPHACIDRLRASLSALLRLLALHFRALPSEVLIVEWNTAEAITPLDEAFEQVVETPAEDSPPVRILRVSPTQHAMMHNPLNFSLLEFMAKNVAARRSCGQFLLFSNPDDVFSEALVRTLAERKLRDDVFYGNYRGAVEYHVPVSEGASALSMQRLWFG